jgi:hypothetical protein
MPDIRASVEVRALIGADKLRELHGDALVRYACWQSSREVRITQPTPAIVLAYRLFRVVKLALAACADSQIIGVSAAAMRTVAGRTAAWQHGHQVQGAGRQARCGENHLARKCLA